jgi:transketolase C-terminal domain/subunit
MAELSYREAVARGIAQEMDRDPRVMLIGEDVAAAGGVFKTTEGLLDRFGPKRVRDTPISEEAITGLVMGSAMNGLRPIGEIMFSDFFATTWDIIANQIAKTRYMTGGQVELPLVLRAANGGGARFGGQHSQSVENWAMAIPGLKVVAPSNSRDVIGLLAASVRDDNPVIFLEHKALFATKSEVPDGEVVGDLGRASTVRAGSDVTIIALAAMVPKAVAAGRGDLRRGHRPANAGPARRGDDRRLGRQHRAGLHRRGESTVVWLGRRDCVDHRRRVLLGPRWPGGQGHHATRPATGRRRTRGSGDSVGRADRRHGPSAIGLTSGEDDCGEWG